MNEIQEVELLRGRPRKYKKRKRKKSELYEMETESKFNWKLLLIYAFFALIISFLIFWLVTSTSLLDNLKKLFILE